ncbi:ProQ/FINO family protein [Acidovorax sp. Be4]|uniref:ProQ/FINO family protein n=1 Tax=Acidovorax bellezanensis TaxID=2976702 RepID=A0ABT2PPY9_9BURK|nr:ProQ/FINO family protein [Acidovorax sp. Be4]MCT9811337.1 ProQ/FINO family protein [Acidovorax sp. Be4]
MTDPVSEPQEQNTATPATGVTPAVIASQADTGADVSAAADSSRKPRRRGGRGRRATPAGAAPAAERSAPAAERSAQGQGARAPRSQHPMLLQLADFYPQLFGETPLPMKRGIFQDLLDAQPEAFDRDGLKVALSIHTRSSRYLTAVAAGQPRHDLQGQPVEAMAAEHVHHALLEVFRRRQQRSAEDLRPKLLGRIIQAFEASGLSREAYAERVQSRDDAANALVDEALAEAAARAAKDEALLRAFEASGQDMAAFADMYGMVARSVAQTVERARRRKAQAAAAAEQAAAAPAAGSPAAGSPVEAADQT